MPYPYFQPNYQQGYFPVNYPQAYQQNFQQPTAQQAQPQMQQGFAQNQNQIQNGGFVTVRSESDARNYPTAPGTSVTFKHETAPFLYTKTASFNQFEAPRFEKFRLVKEEDAESSAQADGGKEQAQAVEYAKEKDLCDISVAVKVLNDITAGIKADVETLKTDFYGMQGRKRIVKKQEPETDE
jgi:hypothetical protein